MKIPILLALATTGTFVFGQETPPEPHTVRFLPVGARAPFLQEVRDGVRYEVDPPEGSLPPRLLTVSNPLKKDGKKPTPGTTKDLEGLRVRLGEISAPMLVAKPEEMEMTFHSDGKDWLRSKLTESDRTLIVAWRTGETWDQAMSYSIDDSDSSVPHGSVRVINVAPTSVGVLWGDKRIGVKPQSSVLLPFSSGSKGQLLTVLHPTEGGSFARLLQTSVANSTSVRRQWVVFRSDRDDARKPYQVISLSEPR
ncbi:MAG: hypothetical protein ACQKBU_03905 [Verrucomicrobiales bacterium]